jgi:hypothetical protein
MLQELARGGVVGGVYIASQHWIRGGRGGLSQRLLSSWLFFVSDKVLSYWQYKSHRPTSRRRRRRRGNAIDRLEEDEEEEEETEEEEEDAPQMVRLMLVLVAAFRFLGTPADPKPFGLKGRGETEGGRKQERGRRRRREAEGARGRERATAWNNFGGRFVSATRFTQPGPFKV